MKILFVVARPIEINTSASIRNRAVIEGLVELGHEVHVVTTNPDKNHNNYDQQLFRNSIRTTYFPVGGVSNFSSKIRGKRFLEPLRVIAYNIVKKFEIYDTLKPWIDNVKDLDINDESYDAVISSSDPKSSHLFVLELFNQKKINKTKWYQIWGDPMTIDITSQNKILVPKIKAEEDRLLSRANKVFYVSPLTLEAQKQLFSKYAYKMNCIPIPYVEKVIYEEIKKSEITVAYCGDYNSHVRNIMPLYNSVRKGGYAVSICGASDINLMSTEKISVKPRIGFKEVKEIEKNSDVLVHLSNRSGTQIPGKIYQYSGTNKHILFILDGEKTLIKGAFIRYNRFIFCDNTEESITNALKEIESGKYDDLKYPVKDFESINVASMILE